MTVAVLDNMLATYHEGKQIALHMLSYNKNSMTVNKHRYLKMSVRQSFDTENTFIDKGKSFVVVSEECTMRFIENKECHLFRHSQSW